MNIIKYLIITPKYSRYNQTHPTGADVKIIASLKGGRIPSNAVPLKLELNLPDALFSRPQLQATIKIDESSVSAPVIDAQVLDNIKQELQKQIGVDLTINIVENESNHSL